MTHANVGDADAIALPHVLFFCAPRFGSKLAVKALRAGVGRDGDSEQLLAGRSSTR